jgi:hypothetical protein
MKERISERIEYLCGEDADEEVVFNLSATGVSFLRNKPEDINSIIKLRINNFVLSAKVIYCQKRADGYRLGLQFWQMTSDKQKLLRELVEGFSKGVPVQCSIVNNPPPAGAKGAGPGTAGV